MIRTIAENCRKDEVLHNLIKSIKDTENKTSGGKTYDAMVKEYGKHPERFTEIMEAKEGAIIIKLFQRT